MNVNRTVIELPEKGEAKRTDDIFTEGLEVKIKAEPLEGIKVTESNGATVEKGEDDAAASDWEKKQDLWMESVKAFIRNIDIDAL